MSLHILQGETLKASADHRTGFMAALQDFLVKTVGWTAQWGADSQDVMFRSEGEPDTMGPLFAHIWAEGRRIKGEACDEGMAKYHSERACLVVHPDAQATYWLRADLDSVKMCSVTFANFTILEVWHGSPFSTG